MWPSTLPGSNLRLPSSSLCTQPQCLSWRVVNRVHSSIQAWPLDTALNALLLVLAPRGDRGFPLPSNVVLHLDVSRFSRQIRVGGRPRVGPKPAGEIIYISGSPWRNCKVLFSSLACGSWRPQGWNLCIEKISVTSFLWILCLFAASLALNSSSLDLHDLHRWAYWERTFVSLTSTWMNDLDRTLSASSSPLFKDPLCITFRVKNGVKIKIKQ